MASTSVSFANSPHIHIHHHHHKNPISLLLSSSPFIIWFPHPNPNSNRHHRFCALKTGRIGSTSGSSSSSQEGYGSDSLRKPVISPPAKDPVGVEEDENKGKKDDGFVDWEDQILENTVPLVGFVRMILHSGKYESGERLSPDHERTILERLLPYHPECEKKIGCGVDYITIGYHPNFESSRCLFIVRKDGELVDFSYWKCIKGLIRKNYPLYADSFILRHFQWRSRSE